MVEPDDEAPPPSRTVRLAVIAGGVLLVLTVALAWADARWGWIGGALDLAAHQFYEVPALARIRRPGQVSLLRMHGLIAASFVVVSLLVAPRVGTHGRRWCAIFIVGYAIRAACWIAGGNLPMVPGDSPHYVEVASSILAGEGPVKHYVESFFIDYPPIRAGKGVLDDWATPLYAYTLAGAYRLAGVTPGASLEATVAVDKGLAFTLNLLGLPALYVLARRRLGADVALGAMALLAILPVHAIYAGLDLRESLVALTSIAAVGLLTEVWAACGAHAIVWAIAAGVAGGLAVLARNTALALLAATGVYSLVAHRRSLGPMFVWGVVVAAVIAPWAWITRQTYGEPFYTYTKYFQYTFSWTVHHYQEGIPRAGAFYTWANAPEIARVKIKSLLMIAGYSTMIMSLPLLAAACRRVCGRRATDLDRTVGTISLVFVAATLANIADVTQVAQLGRYYLPVFVLLLPTASAGLADWSRNVGLPTKARVPLGLSLVALLWADPTWAYDASWFTRSYQLHWPALREAGDWIKAHPDRVPADARVMTWFPWEVRLASGRTTVLMPRNFSATRIDAVARQYGVTHVLWGSFEPPPHVDPETFGPFLADLRRAVGLTDARELYRSPGDLAYGVRLYRIRGATP